MEEQMLTALKAGLDSLDLRYQVASDPPGATFGITGHNGHFDVRCVLQPQAGLCVIVTRLPFIVPAHRRGSVAEAITRINYGLSLGAFELDFSDGELCFRLGLDVEGQGLSPALVRNLLSPCIVVPDDYLGVLTAIAFGNVSPSEALEQADTAHRAQMLAALMESDGLMVDPQQRRN
jgi:hypothetical protein